MTIAAVSEQTPPSTPVPAPPSTDASERPTLLAPADVRLRWTETGARLLRDGAEIAVRVVWARPLTARGSELAIVDEKKREHALLPSMDALEPESRAVAEQALGERYLIARIVRVHETSVHLGTRYWSVDTDRGPRRFAMREPRKNVNWLVPRERCLIRDTMGNRYEIEALTRLDPRSRAEVDRVL